MYCFYRYFFSNHCFSPDAVSSVGVSVEIKTKTQMSHSWVCLFMGLIMVMVGINHGDVQSSDGSQRLLEDKVTYSLKVSYRANQDSWKCILLGGVVKISKHLTSNNASEEKHLWAFTDPASLCAMLTSFNLRLFSPFHPFVSIETNTAPIELYVPTQCQLTNVKSFWQKLTHIYVQSIHLICLLLFRHGPQLVFMPTSTGT